MPVIAFEVRLRRPLVGGTPFGDVGPYEELKGKLRFAIDPTHRANRRIADVERAPRNAAGRVEFASDVSLLLPVDRARGNGRLVLDVVNRGNTVTVPNFNHATRPVFGSNSDPDPAIDVGDGFLMRHGFALVSCGWQGDLPELPGLYGMDGAEAFGPDGRRLTGRVHTQLETAVAATHLLIANRGHRPYLAADLDEPGALMTVRDRPDAEPVTIARERWRFARVVDGRTVPDPGYVHLDGGFEQGRIYQVTYTTTGAPLRGLGIAALRDCVSWLKHGATRDGNPAAGTLRFAYAYGRSQTGRLLRTLVYEDLNLDEEGREALDGIIANVAGGLRGEFNQRFGQNSKDRFHLMPHLFPFTDVLEKDALTGKTGALHARIDARGSRLKVFYTNTSSEYHRGDASLIHTDPDGTHDVPHGRNTRIYHFTGTEHGMGPWPPTDTVPAAADPSGVLERSQNVRGTIDYGRLLRACLVNLDRWVTEGIEPPPSRHPRIADGSAVAPEKLHAVFERIPGACYPRHHDRPRRLDFGADPDMHRVETLPPKDGPAYGTLVCAVDADGNEVAGIAVPEVAVPLATHTGWTLRHPDIGGEQHLLENAGGTIRFARSRREGEAASDPRLSIEERYRTRDEYLSRIRRAAADLVKAGYLLEEDLERSAAVAARMWNCYME